MDDVKMINFDILEDAEGQYLIFKMVNLSDDDYAVLINANSFKTRKVDFNSKTKKLLLFLRKGFPQYSLNLNNVYDEIKDGLKTRELAFSYQNKKGEVFDKTLSFKLE